MNHDYYDTWSRQRGAPRFAVASAEGAMLRLAGGERVFDLISTNFQAAFGHSDARILSAMRDQLGRLPIASPKAEFPLKSEVTRGLLRLLGLPGGRIFYTTSGAEAVENALKMAREITGARHVLARRRSYHGATLGALSVTGDWRGERHFSLAEWTARIPEPSEDPELTQTEEIIERLGAENVACFVLETVTGMNGVIAPPATWWQGIARLAREHGIFLIIDEVSCGFGRTGPDFAFQTYGLTPDFVCMAKAITGGYVPFGALWTSGGVADFYAERVLSCGLTAYAHPLGLAALAGVLAHFADPAFRAAKAQLTERFAAAVTGLADCPKVRSVRRAGLMAAVELAPGVRVRWEDGLAVGLHLAAKEGELILAPPYVASASELEAAMARLKGLLT